MSQGIFLCPAIRLTPFAIRFHSKDDVNIREKNMANKNQSSEQEQVPHDFPPAQRSRVSFV